MLKLLRKWFSGDRTIARPARTVLPTTARLNLETLEVRAPAAALFALTNANNILRFDSASPTQIAGTVAIQGLNANERVVGIDFRPRTGQMFGLAIDGNGGGTNARLLTINPLTGVSSQVGPQIPTIMPSQFWGFDFNPLVDGIRVINASDQNFVLNPNTGAQTTQTNLNPTGGLIDSSAYDRNFDGFKLALNPGNAFSTSYVINTLGTKLQTQGGINQNPSPGLGQLIDVGPLNTPIDVSSSVGFDIRASAQQGGSGFAFAVFDSNPGTGVAFMLYSINLNTGAATPLGLVGDGTTRLQGLTAPPDNTTVTGITGGSVASTVSVLDSFTNQQRIPPITAFNGFNGALAVGAGDLNRDAIPDVIVGAQAPNGHTKAFDGATGAQLASVLVFPGFNGTVSVAGGDINGDGFDDMIVTAFGANAHVKAISGADGTTELASFFAYPGYLGPTTLGAADFNNDGIDEIIVGAGGQGINGRFGIFDRTGNVINPGGFAFPGFNGAVNLAGGDVNGDGIPDIIVGATGAPGGHTKVFDGRAVFGGGSFTELGSFFAFEQGYISGVSVGVADINQDGRFEALVSPLANRTTEVRAFDGLTFQQIGSFISSSNGLGGTVAGARF